MAVPPEFRGSLGHLVNGGSHGDLLLVEPSRVASIPSSRWRGSTTPVEIEARIRQRNRAEAEKIRKSPVFTRSRLPILYNLVDECFVLKWLMSRYRGKIGKKTTS